MQNSLEAITALERHVIGQINWPMAELHKRIEIINRLKSYNLVPKSQAVLSQFYLWTSSIDAGVKAVVLRLPNLNDFLIVSL